jgi:hypothetical protein
LLKHCFFAGQIQNFLWQVGTGSGIITGYGYGSGSDLFGKKFGMIIANFLQSHYVHLKFANYLVYRLKDGIRIQNDLKAEKYDPDPQRYC